MRMIFASPLLFGLLLSGGIISGMETDGQQPGIELKSIEPFAICSLRHQGPAEDITQVTEDLINLMQLQNISPAGDLIAIYPIEAGKEISDQLEWEVGFPVGSHIAVLQEPLLKREWNYATVAAAAYRGPMSQTNEVLDAIFEWIENEGFQQAGPVMVIYKSMPEANSTSASVEIEIWVPCRSQ